MSGEYDLLRPDVFARLRDQDWFIKAMSLQYRTVAKKYDCVPILSLEKLYQVHDFFWNEAEIGLLTNLPEGSKKLDQYKISAYLCFWLRRLNPIKEVRPIHSLSERDSWLSSGERLPGRIENFILYGNEIVSISTAIQLVEYFRFVVTSHAEGANPFPGRAVNHIDGPTILEFAKILKHKNISAQGLNMALQMYCGVGRTVRHIET